MHAIVGNIVRYFNPFVIILCFRWTGYLLREIRKANIAVPEEEASPAAPPPKQVLEIMVGYTNDP